MTHRAGSIAVSALVLTATACTANRPATLIPQTLASGASPTSTAGSACRSTPRGGNQSVMVEWVDFVQLNGVQYLAGLDGVIPAPRSGDIGTTVGTVRCQLSTLAYNHQPEPSVDGDAAFLSVGTQVHSVRGFAPTCRVVARNHGEYRVYLAHHDVNQRSEPVPCAKAPARTH